MTEIYYYRFIYLCSYGNKTHASTDDEPSNINDNSNGLVLDTDVARDKNADDWWKCSSPGPSRA